MSLAEKNYALMSKYFRVYSRIDFIALEGDLLATTGFPFFQSMHSMSKEIGRGLAYVAGDNLVPNNRTSCSFSCFPSFMGGEILQSLLFIECFNHSLSMEGHFSAKCPKQRVPPKQRWQAMD